MLYSMKFIRKNQVKIFDIITPFGINVSKLLIALLGNSSYHIYSPEETEIGRAHV